MKRKNAARNALVTSIISLLLCVSMLVGTTFAWFTDEVVTGMNTIAAGNLDIELLADGEQVNSATKLFDEVILWEPGMVAYENLQVANVGTLALKYQMTLNFGNENSLNGHKLSEVLKVAVIDKVAAGATREQVLEAAKAAVGQGEGTLSNFYLTGELEAGETGAEQTFVIFWEPNDNATDNLYNANNGQVTSDGEPLHIEFGINLQATQKMSENDSFGNDYDEFASILPKATVNNIGAQSVNATTNDWGGEASSLSLPFTLQFLPNESLDEAMSSEYKYWNADFVVKADHDVPANSMALAGYYSAFCDVANNGNWVALTADEVIPAGTEVRLVETMGGGSIKVSYKDICQYANDGVGFLCSAVDLTGVNAGTTITVELRLYETTSDPADSSNTGVEVGPDAYEVVGTYSYTFGGQWVTLADGTVLFYEHNGDVVLYDTQDVTAVDYAVPAGVTHIGNYAFANNDTIQNVTLPASVVDLGRGFDSNSSIKKVVLNEGLTVIASRAFRSTTALEEVVIPSTVVLIEDNAFQKSGIKTVTIPASVETIGETAFGASKIETVTFEGNTAIQGYCFRGCTELRTVNLLGDDVTFVASTLNGRNSMWFANAESNNTNTNNITFHVANETVGARVKDIMGVGSYVAIYVGETLYAEIN